MIRKTPPAPRARDEVLVSLVAPVWNGAAYLEAFVEESVSALAGSFRHYEIILVDDGSTDESQAIIASYGDQLRTILKPVSEGQASCLNAGFAASGGDLVLFLEADDYYLPETV